MVTKSAKRITGFLGTSALTRPLFMLGAASALLGAGPAQALDANTLPQNPNVVGGKDSFHQSGNTLNVNQSTNRTVIDWRSFDIGSSAQVNFNQPGTSSIAVNRVNASANASQIEGGLHANGQVWILNPNGVFFGKTARVDAAGIVATTANIDANAFMAGSNKLQMTGADHGSVENQGKITVGANGLAAFVAPSVRNSGTINATVGRVALAAGTTYTLDLAGDHLVELGLGSVKAVVDSSGKIVNPGGTIALSAKAAGQVVNSVVNVSGVVTASSVTKSGGTITLGADNVTTTSTAQLSADAGTNGNGGAITSVANVQGNYAGSFSAQGGSASGNGGSVETSGKSVHVDDGIKVNTLASNGLTGSWTVDPDNLTIGTTDSGTDTDTDQSISAATVESQLGTTSVNLKANNTITVNTAIDTHTNIDSNTLTFQDEDLGGLTINLNADITLGAHETLTGQGTVVNVASTGLIQNGIDVALAGGATVNVAAGTYNENLTINKSGLTLLSTAGRDTTTINGQGNTATGTITVGTGANNFTLGGIGHGFTVVGIGTSNWAQEPAAVRFVAANSGSKIIGNRITANGQYGLLTNSGSAITGLVIDSNIFDGKTFTGTTPGGWGFIGSPSNTDESGAHGETNQFSFANTPRQLVTLNSGTSNVQFTNNQVTGTAGGINSAGKEQGNTLVTIDANNALITGNTFAGTTTRYGAQLRARGTTVNISDNTFDSAGLGLNAAVIEYKGQIFTGNTGGAPTDLTSMMAANIFTNRAVWDSQAAGRLSATTAYDVGVSINSAISAAASGDTINVESGDYDETVAINKGLTLQGTDANDRPELTGGILLSGSFSDLTLKDLSVSGDAGGGFVIQGGTVNNLTVDHVLIDGGNVAGRNGFGSGKYSGDITITNSEFKDFTGGAGLPSPTGWVLFDTDSGCCGGGIDGTVLTSVTFTNNVIDNAQGGITFRQLSSSGIYPDVTISGNVVENIGDAVNSFGGIFKVFNAGTVTFSGNNISGIGTSGFNPSGEAAYGAALLTRGVTTLNVTDNTFTDNNMAFAVEPGKALAGTVNFTGNTFDNNKYAIYLPTNVSGSGTINFGAGNNFIDGANTVKDIVWTSASALDLTNVAFNGKLGSAMSNDELFAAEDLITDGLDNAAYGLARLNAGNIYVTAASGSIQNGVAKASDGDTVNVQAGTYDGTVLIDKANLTLESTDGAANTIIDAGGGDIAISISSTSGHLGTITIDGFTVQNWASGGIIQGMSAGPYASMRVTNNVVYGPPAGATSHGNGIQVSGDGSIVSGNQVYGVHLNSPDWSGSDILVVNGSDITVENNIADGDDIGIGVMNWNNTAGMSNIVIRGNTISNEAAEGISIQAFGGEAYSIPSGSISSLTITGNTVTDSASGLGIWDYSPSLRGIWAGTLTDVSDNSFARNTDQISTNFTGADVTPFLDTNAFDATAVNTSDSTTIFGDLQTAIGAASANDTLDVAGTFVTNGQVDINKNLTIAGLSGARATITSSTDQIGGNAANAWILVDPNVTFNLSNVVIDGSGHAIYQALRNEGNSTIDNVDFKNISGGAGSYVGEAIESFGGQVDGGAGSDSNGAGGSAAYLSVTNSTFENIGRIGILVKGDGSTADITGNTYTGKGAGDWLDYGIEVGAGGSASIHGNTITGALGVASVDGSTSAGIIVTTYYGAGTQATIGNNTITGNTAAVDVGYDDNDTSNVRAFSNDFSGNGVELESTNATQDFTGNYWGTTDETAVLGLMSGVDAGSVNFSTFLTNGTDADPASLGFQGDFSHLIVTSLGGGTNRLGEAVSEINAGGTINVNAGTYTLPGTLYIDKSLSLAGAGEGTTTIDGSGISNNFAMRVRADDVSLSGFTVSGPGGISVYSQSPAILHDASISHVTIDVGTAGYTGLTVAYTVGANVDHVTVDGTATGGAGSTGVQIIDASDVTLTNVKTFGNQAGLGIFEDDATGPQVNNINVDTTNSFLEDEPVFIVDTASANGPSLGSVNIQGFKYAVGNQADFGFGPGYLLNDQQTAIDDAAAMDASSSTVQGWTGTGVNNVFTVGFATDGTALSINTAANAATAGGAIDVNSGTYAEDVAIGKQLTFNFDGATVNSFTLASGAAGSVLNGDLTATGAIAFNGATSVTGDLKAASITATDAFALNGNAAASGAIALNGATTLAGNLTGGSIALGATTLTGNTSLDTSAANGAITVASVNGSTAGGQSLAIKAGTGSVSLGNAGATTRLGAVSDASKTTLTGSTYNANSFLFGGDVTLTSADTTLNTTQSAGAAGNITFQGDLFGTTDGSQSLTLIAGPGTGAASANGDILLQNAGTTAVNLNNLTVSGDDFTALTVDLAGNYNSLLTGNQVFAADTLNVKGNANSIVGGDASGHIVASGDVTIAAGGDVSGTISGENVNLTGDDVNSVVTANNAANIKGNTVEGSYTADTVTLIASNNVDAAVDATDFVLAANHGSVDGTWTTINTDGSNVVSVNGQTTVGMANVNPNQLVVEGFVLPAGTTIGANGQLILPEGTLLGLLSPGGGKPKMILVHTVHQLGELLASGYSVIVIDLSGHGKEKLVQLAAN